MSGMKPEWTPLEHALEQLMSDLSEHCYAAGWLDTCEYDVWAMLVGDRTEWGLCRIDDVRSELDAVWALAEQAGAWIVWDDNPDGSIGEQRSVPLDEWRTMYAAWVGKDGDTEEPT